MVLCAEVEQTSSLDVKNVNEQSDDWKEDAEFEPVNLAVNISVFVQEDSPRSCSSASSSTSPCSLSSTSATPSLPLAIGLPRTTLSRLKNGKQICVLSMAVWHAAAQCVYLKPPMRVCIWSAQVVDKTSRHLKFQCPPPNSLRNDTIPYSSPIVQPQYVA